MKRNCFSIFSLWRKYKILLYFNLTVILVLSMTFSLTAAGIRDVKSHPKDTPQQVTVKGVVTDASTKETMPGVNVTVSGTTLGTMTDASGNFTLEVPNASATLQFSFIGYVTQSVPLGGRTTLSIEMMAEVAQLSEVVVVGYGTQARKDLTGSISSVNSERLLDKPAFNVAEAISGKVAGVKIVTAGGQPGGGTIFMRIRGTNSISTNNSPLFVVDGIVGVANALTILNPADIKSVDVLKDASATAIYGARGSNGVIMITTKRGVSGKVQVEYNGSYTRGWRQKDFVYNNSEQFLYVLEQAWRNITKYSTSQSWSMCPDASLIPASYGTSTTTYSNFGYLFEKTTPGGYTIPLIGADGNYYKPRFDTNFEDLSFPPSNSTDHNISARGGSDNAKFNVFLGYTLDDGLLENSWFKRYSGKVSGDFKVAKWLDIATQIGVNHNNNRTNDVSYFSGGISRAASESYPVIPPQFPNDPSIYGVYAGVYGENVYFPVGEADCQSPYQITKTVETFTKRDQYIGDVTLTFHITKNLDLKSNFAVDDNDSKYNNYGGIRVSRSNQGNANINTSKTFYWQNENYLTYINNFGNHSVTGMLGLSWSKYTYENLNTYNRLFFDDFYGWHNIGVGTYARPAPSSSDGMNSLNSYFGRFNYSYKGKYLLTLTGRIDGSSKFGANSKYGFFPSGSFAWNIGQEDFIKSHPTISNLKLRLSVGQTGNQEIGSYVTQAFLNSTNVALGESVYPGLYPSSMANPDLRWEKTTQYDAGVDLGLFIGRINLIFDAYYKLTTDMLLSVPLPYSTTVGSVQENYGSVSNKGLEITLNTHNVKSNNFNWYTNITWSANKNVIEKLGPTGADIRQNSWVGGYNTILREGKSVSEIFGLNRLGTYSTQEVSLAARYGFVPGDVKYEDRNNDGLISFYTDGDILGSTLPKWDMDFTNTMDYRNFDFNIDIRISYGAKKENRTNHSGEDRQVMDNSKNRVLDAWRPDHQNTMIGQLRPGMGGSYYQTYPDTHWVEDASFIRGESATLGYNIEKKFLGINRLRVYANLKNFFVLTKYTGYDPEGSDNDNMGAALVPGMDFYMYPRPTELTFGVNIVF
jgi:TonB-linked SusC/RagA family outer membrane protein